MAFEFQFLTPRRFQVDKITATLEPATGEGSVLIVPLVRKRPGVVVCGHLIITDTETNETTSYDLRMRSIDGGLSLKGISGRIPKRACRLT